MPRKLEPFTLVAPRYGSPPKIPGRAFTISNSERGELACDRRWLLGYGERLRPKTGQRALDYGSAWALVMEDLHRWWMERDGVDYPLSLVLQDGPDTTRPIGSCPWCATSTTGHQLGAGSVLTGEGCAKCGGSKLSVLFRVLLDWREEVSQGRRDAEKMEEDALTLFRALRGYCHVYGTHGPLDYRVVGVEVPVAAPIRHPVTGAVFRPRMLLVDEGTYLRLPYPGEVHGRKAGWTTAEGKEIVAASFPWWQIGKLDVVLQHRGSGILWIEDAKSSRDPWGYLRLVSVDPQTTGYSWLLRETIARGDLPFQGEVGGIQFDVASSSLQHYPKRLVEKELAKKDEKRAQGLTHHPPAYSTAKNITTPSWLYLEALQTAAPGPDGQTVNVEDYAEHLDWCRETWDQKLYAREPLGISEDAIREYLGEIYGVAARIALHWKHLGNLTPETRAVSFPKVPLCRKPGGSCSFVPICMGGDGPEVREDYEVTEGLRWYKGEAPSTAISETVPTTLSEEF